MKSKGFSTVYVDVGHPSSDIPTVKKALLQVNLDEQTEVQAAKLLRKHIADHICHYGWNEGTKLTPAQLYYEIYDHLDAIVPKAMSFNSPYRAKNVRGIL